MSEPTGNGRILKGLGLLAGLLVAVLSLAALSGRWPGVSRIGSALAFALGGTALSVVLFAQDEDLKSFKTLIIGAITGTGFYTAHSLVEIVRQRVWWMQSSDASLRGAGIIFIFNGAAAVIGVLFGFLLSRFWLDRAIALEKNDLEKLLHGVQAPSGKPWPESKSEAGETPPPESLDALEKKTDWSGVPGPMAILAGTALLQSDRAAAALRPLEHAVMDCEPPSPIAFDLFAGALAQAADYKNLDGPAIGRAERALSRMLTFWPDSYLVNLDAGYLYLYVPGRADLAVHYSKRAQAVRPRSPSVNLNLACALAASAGPSPADAMVDEITRLLDIYLDVEPSALSRFDAQGDFDALKANPRYSTWRAARKPA